jgi:hypothetical protein
MTLNPFRLLRPWVGKLRALFARRDPPAADRTIPQTLSRGSVGEKGIFTVRLSAPPRADVTILLSAGQLTPGASTLTFTPANWDVPKPVTILRKPASEKTHPVGRSGRADVAAVPSLGTLSGVLATLSGLWKSPAAEETIELDPLVALEVWEDNASARQLRADDEESALKSFFD